MALEHPDAITLRRVGVSRSNNAGTEIQPSGSGLDRSSPWPPTGKLALASHTRSHKERTHTRRVRAREKPTPARRDAPGGDSRAHSAEMPLSSLNVVALQRFESAIFSPLITVREAATDGSPAGTCRRDSRGSRLRSAPGCRGFLSMPGAAEGRPLFVNAGPNLTPFRRLNFDPSVLVVGGATWS
jgi:hypothetical protein